MASDSQGNCQSCPAIHSAFYVNSIPHSCITYITQHREQHRHDVWPSLPLPANSVIFLTKTAVRMSSCTQMNAHLIAPDCIACKACGVVCNSWLNSYRYICRLVRWISEANARLWYAALAEMSQNMPFRKKEHPTTASGAADHRCRGGLQQLDALAVHDSTTVLHYIVATGAWVVFITVVDAKSIHHYRACALSAQSVGL